MGRNTEADQIRDLLAISDIEGDSSSSSSSSGRILD